MRTIRWRSFLPAAFGVGLFLAGCGTDGVGRLFQAEREVWRASRLEKALRVGPDAKPTPAETDRVLAAYQRILGSTATGPGSPADSAVAHGIGRVRAQALMGIIRMHRLRNEPAEVRATLEAARKAFPWDTGLTLRFHQELVDELRSSGDLDAAANLYQEMAASLPARRPDGRPNVLVQDAPIRAAEILSQLARPEEAAAELDRAEAYYHAIIQENPDDAAASLAWLELASVAAQRGEYAQADEILEGAGKSAGAREMEPRILLIRGTLQQEALQNPEGAASLFQELVERFPDDPSAPEALIRRGAALADLRRYDEALAALKELKAHHERDRASCAKGELLAARILVRADRWQEALSRYRALMADYPTSQEALAAPFEMEAHYREVGEAEAASNTMERALDQFGELRDAYPGTGTAWTADESSARALIRLGRVDEAVTKLLGMPDLYPRDPRNPVLLFQTAGILADRLKDRQRAADALDQLVSRYPSSPLAEKARAEAARLRGQ